MSAVAAGQARVPVLGDAFVREVEAASGAGLMLCLQCQKCTSGCPIAGRADVKPHEMIRLIQLGLRDDVLTSRMIWECTSCETCGTRCPQAVAVPEIMDALRRLSRAANKVNLETAVPAFNDVFLGSVKQTGRVHELGLMAVFKLRTRDFLRDVDKLPSMLRKGKFALLPAFVRGRSGRTRLFRRAARKGGAKR